MRFFLPLALGLALIGFGLYELRLSQRAGRTPLPVEMGRLEQSSPEQLYLTLGEHVPVYDLVIYITRGPHSNEIEWVYYPIVSRETYNATVEKTAGKPEEEFLRQLPVHVLARTRRYQTVDELQRAVKDQSLAINNVTGMIVSPLARLGEVEHSMLQKRFPNFDSSGMVIFELDKKPTTPFIAYGALAGGLVCLALCLALKVRR